jgi:hypothetical protein
MIDDLRENLPQLRQALRELPGVIRELSERATAGDLTLDLRSAEIERIRRELEGQRQQRYWLIVAMTSLLAGTLVLTLQGNLYIGGGLLRATFTSAAACSWPAPSACSPAGPTPEPPATIADHHAAGNRKGNPQDRRLGDGR